jgi:hypothetical protein
MSVSCHTEVILCLPDLIGCRIRRFKSMDLVLMITIPMPIHKMNNGRQIRLTDGLSLTLSRQPNEGASREPRSNKKRRQGVHV